ncbi:type II and III secretion system protein family protein [Aestuariispira ectoiniformans]|uniref:type II and III secretion system protein family protein n=1 Tax=Aestuariispira ectoiniformans TaxID=2775080 RepID=UPI00223BA888|nr:type II and III secretion system protein family protein [Aestuariispira ectoiniformans]
MRGCKLAMQVTILMIAFAVIYPAQAVEIISGAGTKISVEASHGRLIRLPGRADTVFVADPEVADVQVKSPTLVYLMARKPGTTTLFAVDGRDRVLASLDIQVIPDLPKLQQKIDTLYPGVDVAATALGENVVLRGTVVSPSQAEGISKLAATTAGKADLVVNQMKVATPSQVNLRVRVAEMSRTIQKQLGFNWTGSGVLGTTGFTFATVNPFAASVTAQTVGLTGIGGRNVNVTLDALDDEGLIKILAEPNLTAMSGETASFLAGGEFPILVPGSDGRVTIVFKQFGVSLAFTPTILDGGRINLHVRPEVSQLSNTNAVTLNTFQIPSLTTRRAETTVEVGSGESFAIAGLISNDVTHDVSRLPGLADIPILGALFSSDNFRRDESELVIVVTPYVVRPVAQAKLMDPTEGYYPPTDSERVLGSSLNRQPKKPAPKGATVDSRGNRLIGPVGFQFE